jgi:chromosomal replication initiation ATPase DnaA
LTRSIEDIDNREQSALIKINTPSVKDVIATVAEYFKIKDIMKITVRRGAVSEARKITMFLASKHCRSVETLSSIASRFGVKLSGLNMARGKIIDRLKTDDILQHTVDEIEQMLNDKNSKM